MSEMLLRVDNVKKAYRLGQYGGDTFRKETAQKIRKLMGKPVAQEKLFYALDGVSFEAHRGEALGIIGSNGAGKSTLLKIISRITAPTEGEIAIRGRVSSLLEIGTGFHPELTGRENIYLNGAIMGLTQAQIRSRMKDILEFSENEKFIDTPAKRYSSGMLVKLGFAVAANLNPNILICDEVLAVGDVAFQQKCLAKMSEVVQEGNVVLYVSHNMRTVQQLCNRVICLNHGTVTYDGDPQAGIEQYVGADGASGGRQDFSAVPRMADMGQFVRLEWAESAGAADEEQSPDGEMFVRVGLWSDGSCRDIRVRATWTVGDYAVGTSESEAMDLPMGRHEVRMKLPLEMLSGGEYVLQLEVSGRRASGVSILDHVGRAMHVTLKDDRSLNLGLVWAANYWGNIRIKGAQAERME